MFLSFVFILLLFYIIDIGGLGKKCYPLSDALRFANSTIKAIKRYAECLNKHLYPSFLSTSEIAAREMLFFNIKIFVYLSFTGILIRRTYELSLGIVLKGPGDQNSKKKEIFSQENTES